MLKKGTILADEIACKAQQLKADIRVFYRCMRDAQTPLYLKILLGLLLAYLLSPIDLIPDFIPVLGLLDDIIIVVLGYAVLMKLMPAAIVARHQNTVASPIPKSLVLAGTLLILFLWAVLFVLLVYFLQDLIR